ncbi:MAG: secretin N-terminal domain-containing protein, partial [Planctomycetota bacterium]
MNRQLIRYSALATLALPATLATAQNGRPAPTAPQSAPPAVQPADASQGERPSIEQPEKAAGDAADLDRQASNGNGITGSRRKGPEGKVILAFDNVSVEETIPFIVEMTGKVVMPVKLATLKTQTITLINDNPIDRAAALDLLFAAFRLNEIGVVEKEDRIILGQINDIVTSGIDLPVLGPEDEVMYRQDLGNFVVKVFRLERATAQAIGEHLEDTLPDYANLTVDENSNQIVVTGDIALMQHLQQVILKLDKTYIKVKTKTYQLRYADASEIADNIVELFEQDSQASGASRSQPRTTRRTATSARQRQANAAAQATTGQPGPVAEMRLTVNTQQNAVTVQSDPNVMDEIDKLIYEYWDLPRPEGTSKIYALRYSDPIKVRDMLQELLQGGSTASRATTNRAGGGGQRAGVEQAISGVYKMEAFPDSNSLLVLAKTEDTFGFLDSIIQNIDQPTTVGLPIIIELKHAEAVSLADELNVLLSEPGSQMVLQRPDSGLSAQGMSTTESGGGGGASGATGREREEGADIRFPWQSGGRDREDQSPETPLIGKTRIVPIIRQNALAILAPPQYQENVREIIQYLDRPGRQVMISAVIAEVELNDDFALGLRFSREGIPLTNIDASLGG